MTKNKFSSSIFEGLEYIKPAWYFHLNPRDGNIPYILDYRKLSCVSRNLIQFDYSYSSEGNSLLDAAYQAFQKGIVEGDPQMALTVDDQSASVSDKYRFIRKFFHPIWAWYFLFVRLLLLKNPVDEIVGFVIQRKTKRIELYKEVYPHESLYLDFNSYLLQSAPKISVIIPTLNRYSWLKDALHDLEQQDYTNFDVIVVDQSEPYQPEFYKNFNLEIQVIRQEEKALWLARNSAISLSTNEFIAMYEDDVRVPNNWLSHHLKCMDFFKCDISAGVFFPKSKKTPSSHRFFRWSEQFATGNACLRRRVFEVIGLFDRQFERQRAGDGEFGLRGYLAGFKSISNPYAYCEDVKAPSGGLRQMGSWDAFRPKKWTDPRPVPSVLYFIRKYFGNKAAILSILISVPPSVLPYRFKGKSNWMIVGSVLCVLIVPIVLFQVVKSWWVSTQMITKGPEISSL